VATRSRSTPRLEADLINCPGDGLAIGADDVTLDLNGHLIDGDGVRGGPGRGTSA